MGQPFIGEIRMFAGNFAPAGWHFCDGALLAISENDALFNLIGTTYGGDGQSTFALPNLQSRVPVHQGNNFVIGEMGGEESVTLTVNQIPTHTHAAMANSAAGGNDKPTGNVWAANANTGIPQFTALAPDSSLPAAAVAPAGGSQPHDNMMPFLAINFIISLFGLFPHT
ncbi:MAG: phage tail protein [Pyrinomonadaceae bacterium]